MAGDDEEIPRDSWQKALADFTVEHQGELATIEVAGLDLGDQLEAEQLPFSYVEYDRHDDAVSVGVGGLTGKYPVNLRHVVEHPEKVFVHANEVGSETIEVRSTDGTVTLVTLTTPAELPA
jgi:Family of unknown function (DUF5335)